MTIVRQSSLNLKPYVRPSFSYIMSLRDVVIHVTCLHRRHFLYEMDIWLKTRSCRKSKAGLSELGLCKFKLYVVIFHNTNFNENRSRTPSQNQLKISCTSSYFFYYVSPPLGDGGIKCYRPFVKKCVPCNNMKTRQHNHFKITCLEMLLRTSHTDQVRISL